MSDTPPEVAEMLRQRYMALSGGERMRMGAESFEAAKAMIIASLPPNLTNAERRRMLYRRIYGEELPADFEERTGRG